MSDNPISCNRRAFERDENCDRGTVDVNQFDDLPFCDPINPSEPDIPPEIVDTPLNLPIPPACSCINISYKFKTHYGSSRTSTAGFKAIGDCCSGNYESSINLAVPCPVPSKFNQKSFAVKNVRGAKSVGVDLLSKTDECSFQVDEAGVDLQVECPIPDKINPITLSKVWVDTTEESGKEQTWEILTNGDECTFDVSKTLDLKIPCPLPYKLNPVKVTKEWKDPDEFENNQEIEYLKNEDCKITLNDINLTIPCPLPYKLNPVKVTKEWKDPDEFENNQEIEYLKNEDCKITLNDINLTIPCPLPQGEQGIVLRPEWTYVEDHNLDSDLNSGKEVSVEELPSVREDKEFYKIIGKGKVCSYSFADKISLDVECPIQGKITVRKPKDNEEDAFQFKITDKKRKKKKKEIVTGNKGAVWVEYKEVEVSACDVTNIDFLYPKCAVRTYVEKDEDKDNSHPSESDKDEDKDNSYPSESDVECIDFGGLLAMPCQVKLDEIVGREVDGTRDKEEVTEGKKFFFKKKNAKITDCDISNYEFVYTDCIFKIKGTCVKFGQNINIVGGTCTNLESSYSDGNITLSLYWT